MEKESRPLDPAAFQIDGVDMNAAMQYYSDDEEGFVELLELYCIDGKRKTDLLCEVVESDLLRYQIEVHGLKSASANIGAMKVSDMAREQETAAIQENRKLINRKFPLLLEEYQNLLANIEQFLEWRRQENGKKEKLPRLLTPELREQAAAALEELKHFRSQKCAERVETTLAHQLPEDTAKRLLEIQKQLRLYEDDYADSFRPLVDFYSHAPRET